MHLLATVTCITAFASFGWGVLRFFTKPSGLTWGGGITALLGLFFGGWHIHAIAASTTEPWQAGFGVVAHAISTAIFWSAVGACESRQLTAIFESDLPVHLVRGGPYRYLRHPFYAAYTIFWLGGWMASGSLVALLSVAIMLAMYVDGARKEERKFSRSPLAEEYAEYRQRVGAWLPRLPRHRY